MFVFSCLWRVRDIRVRGRGERGEGSGEGREERGERREERGEREEEREKRRERRGEEKEDGSSVSFVAQSCKHGVSVYSGNSVKGNTI